MKNGNAYLPKLPTVMPPMPDEVLYSWFVRLAEANFFPVFALSTMCAGWETGGLRVPSHFAHITVDGRMDPEAIERLTGGCFVTAGEVMRDLTMWPYAGPFGTDRFIDRFENDLGTVNRGYEPLARSLRACPECMAERIAVDGFVWYDRLSQVPDVKICPVHRSGMLRADSPHTRVPVWPNSFSPEPAVTDVDAEAAYSAFVADFARLCSGHRKSELIGVLKRKICAGAKSTERALLAFAASDCATSGLFTDPQTEILDAVEKYKKGTSLLRALYVAFRDAGELAAWLSDPCREADLSATADPLLHVVRDPRFASMEAKVLKATGGAYSYLGIDGTDRRRRAFRHEACGLEFSVGPAPVKPGAIRCPCCAPHGRSATVTVDGEKLNITAAVRNYLKEVLAEGRTSVTTSEVASALGLTGKTPSTALRHLSTSLPFLMSGHRRGEYLLHDSMKPTEDEIGAVLGWIHGSVGKDRSFVYREVSAAFPDFGEAKLIAALSELSSDGGPLLAMVANGRARSWILASSCAGSIAEARKSVAEASRPAADRWLEAIASLPFGTTFRKNDLKEICETTRVRNDIIVKAIAAGLIKRVVTGVYVTCSREGTPAEFTGEEWEALLYESGTDADKLSLKVSRMEPGTVVGFADLNLGDGRQICYAIGILVRDGLLRKVATGKYEVLRPDP